MMSELMEPFWFGLWHALALFCAQGGHVEASRSLLPRFGVAEVLQPPRRLGGLRGDRCAGCPGKGATTSGGAEKHLFRS